MEERAGRRRLLVVAHTVQGGSGASAVAHARWFARHGWEVVLAGPGEGTAGAGEGFRFQPLRMPSTARDVRALLGTAAVLRRTASTFRPDVVHCHGARAFAAARLAGLRRPFLTLHGTSAGPDDPWGYGALRRAGLLLCARSAAAALSVFPDPPPGWSFLPHASPRLAGLPPLGPPPTTVPTFLCLGALEARKRPQHFVAAMALLGRRGPPVRGILAGSGPLWPALARQVRACAAPVEMVGHVEDVAALLEQSWAVVLPSASEGVPFALQEAMWAGRAVVCSPLPGARWLLSDPPRGGLLAETPDQLAAALAQLCDPAHARQAGTAAAERIRSLLCASDPWPEVDRLYRSSRRA